MIFSGTPTTGLEKNVDPIDPKLRIHGHGIYEIWHRQSKNKKGTIKSQNQWDINGKSMGNQLENQWGINGKSIERQSLKYNGKSMGSKK